MEALSDPWPLPGVQVDGILVDGAHDYETVCHDVTYACQCSLKWILAHDVKDPEVERAVTAAMGPGWLECERTEAMKGYSHE